MTSSSGAQMYGGIIPYVAQALATQKVYKSMPLVKRVVILSLTFLPDLKGSLS